MVPTRSEEVSSGVVSIHCSVLGTIKDGIVDREHGRDGQDLLTALVSTCESSAI